jgi:hypothetical protein
MSKIDIKIEKDFFLPLSSEDMNKELTSVEWSSDSNRTNLKTIADALISSDKDNQNNEKYSMLKTSLDEFSIPSPWAKFILFETALSNKNLNELHKRVKYDWRGILAILALKDFKGV